MYNKIRIFLGKISLPKIFFTMLLVLWGIDKRQCICEAYWRTTSVITRNINVWAMGVNRKRLQAFWAFNVWITFGNLTRDHIFWWLLWFASCVYLQRGSTFVFAAIACLQFKYIDTQLRTGSPNYGPPVKSSPKNYL